MLFKPPAKVLLLQHASGLLLWPVIDPARHSPIHLGSEVWQSIYLFISEVQQNPVFMSRQDAALARNLCSTPPEDS